MHSRSLVLAIREAVTAIVRIETELLKEGQEVTDLIAQDLGHLLARVINIASVAKGGTPEAEVPELSSEVGYGHDKFKPAERSALSDVQQGSGDVSETGGNNPEVSGVRPGHGSTSGNERATSEVRKRGKK